jgi:hypothetical protein
LSFRGIAGMITFYGESARARERERARASERASERARERERERERERGAKTRRQINGSALFNISTGASNTYNIHQCVSLADAEAKR